MTDGKRVAGIIAEFNPFHEGHRHIISRAREVCSADFVVVAMSGDFVQRGAPAIFSKYARAKMALENGADLVLQMPVMFSTASAEDFAACGVAMLARAGIVDDLVFGAESASLAALDASAALLCEEPAHYRERLLAGIRAGKSFPRARMEALAQEDGVCAPLFPNDILGIEYLKAIRRQGARLNPVAVQREQHLGSAHAARARYYEAYGIEDQGTHAARKSAEQTLLDLPYRIDERPVHIDDFSAMLSYKLLNLSYAGTDLCVYQDVSQALANRIMADAAFPYSFTERIARAKSKQYTWTRVARCLIHILLDIRACDVNLEREAGYVRGLRVLGFRREASGLLGKLKAPLITSPARVAQDAPEGGLSFRTDLYAADVYNVVHRNFQTEYTRKLLTTVL